MRRELESYGVQVRSSWGGQELAEVLGRARAEKAETRRAAKRKQRQEQEHGVGKNENSPPELYNDSTTDASKDIAFIDVEHVPDEEESPNKQVVDVEKKRRPIISRIGGFLSRRKRKPSGKSSKRKKESKSKVVESSEPAALNKTTELPFFLEFLEQEEADTGPISVEVVRLNTETRYSEEEELDHAEGTKGGPRKRLLYTRGLGRNKRSKKAKAKSRTVISPMGEFESTPNFIDTYSRGERKIEYQHHFQVLQDDESTTHKLQHGDPTLLNCTVIDVPSTHIHIDYRDSHHFSNLRCDDWDGFTA